MNNKEAIELIDQAIAELEWDYTMDYVVALEKAKEALTQVEGYKMIIKMMTDEVHFDEDEEDKE